MKPPAHSKTFAAKLEKISKQVKYLPLSRRLKLDCKYFLARREFLNRLNAEKNAGAVPSALATIENHWSYERHLISDEINDLITGRLLRKSGRLCVPVPVLTFGFEDNKCWEKGWNDHWHLTDEGVSKVREEIYKERKRRQESRSHWVQLGTGVTALIGGISGWIAFFLK